MMYAIKDAFETLGITGDPKLAIEKEEIASYLFNSPKYQGMFYNYQWVNGQKISPIYLMQIKNNQFVYVATANPTTTTTTTTTSTK